MQRHRTPAVWYLVLLLLACFLSSCIVLSSFALLHRGGACAIRRTSRAPQAAALVARMSQYSSGGGRGGGRGRGGGGGGRGEYYRNKYGGGGGARGGRGGGGGRQGSASSFPPQNSNWSRGPGGGTYQDLQRLLQQIDGRQYPSYHDIETTEQTGWVNDNLGFTLHVGRAQSDPYAPPTRCRVVIAPAAARIPASLVSNKIRRVATADYLWRRLYQCCVQMGADRASGGGGGWKGPKGGDLRIMQPTQHVVEQSAVEVDASGGVQCQLTVNLPARGRTVLGNAAAQVLGDPTLGRLVREAVLEADASDMARHVESVEDQAWLQSQLSAAGLVAFVRDGAVLPRRSGVDDRPMVGGRVIPFESPKMLQTSFTLPNSGVTVTGMGIAKGITLICGGGFHGKSTLLEALQLAVYWKIPGDGREFCCTAPNAVKIRAEDGRSVNSVNISSFIKNLPFGDDTTCFSTADASGSTSQASNIVEAIEVGADVLLIDEDTCATNFMIRDNKMMQLVACDREPITPFVRVVQSLKQQGVSTVMVVGGTGDFFDVADHVLVMDTYHCADATERARQIAAEHSRRGNEPQPTATFVLPAGDRAPEPSALNPGGKVKVLARNVIAFGDTEIDLSALEQLVSDSQANAIAHALQWLASNAPPGNLASALAALERSVDDEGLNVLARGQFNGSFMRPRLLEIGAAINRLRRAAIKKR